MRSRCRLRKMLGLSSLGDSRVLECLLCIWSTGVVKRRSLEYFCFDVPVRKVNIPYSNSDCFILEK